MKILANSKLVMIGDSITDANRARPIGDGPYGQLGQGYVALVDALLGTAVSPASVHVINVGISGNTVRDLKGRWQSDVLDLKPDWLSIMIGTNDVWRQFDAADRPEIHVLPQEYETTLNNLVTQTRPTLKGLVLMTPFFIEPDMSDPMRIRMDQYGAIVRKIATGSDVLFVDTQAAFDAAMKHHKPAHLADDRVHPTLTGHMVLAKAFLKAVRFAG